MVILIIFSKFITAKVQIILLIQRLFSSLTLFNIDNQY
nr:MAG TPA: hypothetical protein [Caudoviricetes sp.]